MTYLEQAQHNRAVAEALSDGDSPTSRQWDVTCLFYAALHYVNAHLGNRPVPDNHQDRDRYVRGNMQLIHNDYRWLRTKSHAARYCLKSPPKQVVEAAFESRQYSEVRPILPHRALNRPIG